MGVDRVDLSGLVKRCTQLESRDQLGALLDEVRSEASAETVAAARENLGSLALESQPEALLSCAAYRLAPSPDFLVEAFRTDRREILATAALALVLGRLGDEEGDLLRCLLVASSPTIPLPISRSAGYYLVEAMRLSGDRRFVEPLTGAFMKSYHFLPRVLTARALGELGAPPDENKTRWRLSISVVPAGSDEGILIHDDEKYRGASNCPDCRFFPCRINDYFRGGIEDCKMWNRVDPATRGEIVDQRDWGPPMPLDAPVAFDAEGSLVRVRDLLDGDDPCAAVSLACSVLLEAEKTGFVSSAWVNLGRCLEKGGEPALAAIAYREGAATKGLLGVSSDAERKALESFLSDPPADARRHPEPTRRLGMKAQAYRERGLFTCALDCYVEENLREDGKGGGNWFEMGECFRELGELHLAEVCMRRGARIYESIEITLRTKFLAAAEEVRRRRENEPDSGLAVERRARDRSVPDSLAL